MGLPIEDVETLPLDSDRSGAVVFDSFRNDGLFFHGKNMNRRIEWFNEIAGGVLSPPHDIRTSHIVIFAGKLLDAIVGLSTPDLVLRYGPISKEEQQHLTRGSVIKGTLAGIGPATVARLAGLSRPSGHLHTSFLRKEVQKKRESLGLSEMLEETLTINDRTRVRIKNVQTGTKFS